MKKLAIFVSHPYCSVQSVNGIIESLEKKYTFKMFSKHEVEETFFDDIDAVVFPGGIGNSNSYYSLHSENEEMIKQYVLSGGKYIGICMGGYWAGSNYFNLLQGCDTVQYIKSINTDTKRPHPKNLDVIWKGKEEKMFFYDGFSVTKGNYDVYASYKNGEPMAIIQDNIGIIGCHPEATKHWYDSYSWMKNKFVSKQHLLLEFVDEVFKK